VEELEIIMLSEMSTAQKDKHCFFLLMCRPWTESSSPSYDTNVEGRLPGRDSKGEEEEESDERVLKYIMTPNRNC
jgi:hypothetical protein